MQLNHIALVRRPREVTCLLFIYGSLINLGKLKSLLLRAVETQYIDFSYYKELMTSLKKLKMFE